MFASRTITISRFIVYSMAIQAFMAKMEILNQLDNSDKHGIVTDKELLQRGVIYDFKGRMGENLRKISEDFNRSEKTGLQRNFENKSPIPRRTSLVEESRTQGTKNINLLGEHVIFHEDAAALLSLIRDPSTVLV